MSESINPRRQAPPVASVDDPNVGALTCTIGGKDLLITRAIHWVEGGEHIISSTEFQVSGSGETFGAAFHAVVEGLTDEASDLVELMASGEAAPNEIEECKLLSQRFTAIIEANEDFEQERAKLVRKLRRRVRGGKRWQIQPRGSRISATPTPA